MPTAKDIQDKADAIAQPMIDSIVVFQADWVKSHKGYWQGIRTPQITPKDGADTVPDKNVMPVADDEAAAWAQVAVDVPATLPCSVEVFTHDGPKGKGFSVITHIEFGTQKFSKAMGFGSESMLSSGWVEVLPDLIDPKVGK